MASAVEGLQPASVWKYFEEISRIPRCSKHEEAIASYVMKTAAALGCESERDSAGNVVVRKAASPGKASAKGLVLQGHLDMVCEKNESTKHDFSKDPLRLVRKGGFLTADGTTLGADNGIAVAAGLAVAADRSIEHGPLELLFTVDEETGLTGASSLDPGLLKHRTLLNLDSEEEGTLYVGCSGGADLTGSWPLETKGAPAASELFEIRVGGLKGGHSGLEIDKGRGNAIKILARLLIALQDFDPRVVSMSGGNKRNAIPREAAAQVWLPRPKQDAGAAVSAFRSMVAAELGAADPTLSVSLDPVSGTKRSKAPVLRRRVQGSILRAIAALPHGVVKMSADLPGLVESSTNVAVLATTAKQITIETSQRSSVASELRELQDNVQAVFELAGAAVKRTNGYPGWKPNLESPVLKVARRTYREQFGKEAEVKAIHAGLECGIIGERCPGMDMVSFGPTLTGVHSPDERIDVASVEKFWRYLLALLRAID